MTWAEYWTPNKRFISAISSAVSPVRLIQSGVATTPVSADCIRKLCRSIASRFVHSLTSSRGVLPEWSFASKRSMQACQNLASRHFCSRAACRINFSQIANTAALRLFNIRRTVQREMRSLGAISVTDWPAKNLITTWKRCLWRFIVRFLRVAHTEGAVWLSESIFDCSSRKPSESEREWTRLSTKSSPRPPGCTTARRSAPLSGPCEPRCSRRLTRTGHRPIAAP